MFDEMNVIYRYKYLPYSEGSLKVLTDSTIKFTCPLEFNDPFDCKPFFNTTNIDQVPKLRPDLYKEAGKRRGLSPAQRIEKKGEFLARLKNRVDKGDFAKSLISRVGVVSLSKNALNIAMWSHYADFHRGFVLEFRIPIMGHEEDKLFTSELLVPFPIMYRAERPHIEIGKELPDDIVDKLALTKSLDWKYEEEERVIEQKRGPGIHYYRRDEILCSVIAGMDMNENNYKELGLIVKKLIKSSEIDIALYKAEEKLDEYKLIVKNHPRLHNSK